MSIIVPANTQIMPRTEAKDMQIMVSSRSNNFINYEIVMDKTRTHIAEMITSKTALLKEEFNNLKNYRLSCHYWLIIIPDGKVIIEQIVSSDLIVHRTFNETFFDTFFYAESAMRIEINMQKLWSELDKVDDNDLITLSVQKKIIETESL